MGGAPTAEAPPDLPEGAERWGVNAQHSMTRMGTRFEGWTRWFDLHTSAHIQQRAINVYAWECEQTRPIVRWEVDPAMPSSVAYPHAAVRQRFGGTRLFCSTLDWMMALAIYEGFEHVALYGWRMRSPNYRHQIGSARFWLDHAYQAGMTASFNSLTPFAAAPILPPPVLTSAHKMYGLETVDRSQLYHAKG